MSSAVDYGQTVEKRDVVPSGFARISGLMPDQSTGPHSVKNDQKISNDQESVDLIEMARHEFNRNKKIIITSVPLMTQDEVKEFVGNFEYTNIVISKKLRQAIITLKNSTVVDDVISKLDKKMFSGNEVSVRIHPNSKLLCVAQLPIDIKERDFHEIVKSYGETERCFLMRNKKGASKGYGFVEFTCGRPDSDLIRSKLDGEMHNDCILHCDFVKETIVDFDKLNSSCLYVGNLPLDFADDAYLREVFKVVAMPLFCRVARKDDKPVGFAVVEFSKPEEAEETYQRVQGHMIGDKKLDIKYCIPGNLAPEAFNRHLRFLDGKDGLEPVVPKILPVSSVPVITHPPPICSLLVNLLEKYPSVVKNFKQLLLELQKHLNQEQQQLMSDKPGLLGEAPNVNSPLNNPAFQVSLLAVMLAFQLQQSQPLAMSNAAILSMLPPSFNMQAVFGSSGIQQASLLIQAMCDEDDEDEEVEDDEKTVATAEATALSAEQEDKKELEKEARYAGDGKPSENSEAEIPSLMSVTPDIPPLLSSGSSLLTDFDALLNFIEKNHKSHGRHPFIASKTLPSTEAPQPAAVVTDAGAAETSAVASAEVLLAPTNKQEGLLGEPPVPKPGLLGAPPSLLSQTITLNRLNSTGVNPLLASTVEKLIQMHMFLGPQKAGAVDPQSIVNLMDVPLVRPLLGVTAPNLTKGDGLMGARPPTVGPVDLMKMKLVTENAQGKSGILGDGFMGSGPGAGILGNRPWGDGLMGSKPWETEKNKLWQNNMAWGGGAVGSGGFGSGSFSGGTGVGASMNAGGSNFVGGAGDKGSQNSYASGGWEGSKEKSWEGGKLWGEGNNQGDNKGDLKGASGSSWETGKGRGTSGREWEAGMQNSQWEGQQWNENGGGNMWGEGASGWSDGGGSNKFSWSSQQISQPYTEQGFGQGQQSTSVMGEPPTSYGMQGGNNSFEAYYTENKNASGWGGDQYKGGNEQMYYGSNWSGMTEANSSASTMNQNSTVNVSSSSNRQVGQQQQNFGSSGGYDGVTGYGSSYNVPSTSGEGNRGEAVYKSDNTSGGNYSNQVPSNTSGNPAANAGDESKVSAGQWSQYSQYMQQYMQQYASYQNAVPGSVDTAGGSGNMSGSNQVGMDAYSNTSASNTTRQTTSYSGEGQYGQGQYGQSQGQYSQGQGQFGQGQYEQGQYSQGQGQYNQGQFGQNQGQYGQDQGNYGQSQGQYNQGQGQYGQGYSDYQNMKRPFPEDTGNYQYSQYYGNEAKKNRTSDPM